MIRWNKIHLLLILALTVPFLLGVSVTPQLPTDEIPPREVPKESPRGMGVPVGYVNIELKPVVPGIGPGWSKGLLNYNGKKYPFKIRGIQAKKGGFTMVAAQGDVFKLASPDDFSGRYVLLSTAAPIIKGMRKNDFKNSNGVHIIFKGGDAGLSFSVQPEGFYIKLDEAI